MKRNKSEVFSEPCNSESLDGHRSKNFIIAPLDLNSSNSLSPIDDIHDISTQKYNILPVEQLPNNLKGSSFEQLRSEILALFLEMKRVIIEEEDNELLLLRKTIPLKSKEEELQKVEPAQLLDYIRQLFFQVMKIKTDVQRELEDRREAECMDYEPQLQKLEAEVREHIRIEHQLKLYCESLQDKFDDLQKATGNNSRTEENRAGYQEITKELKDLKAKLAARDQEIEDTKKGLREKVDQNHALELQVETLPILKSKIKELERIIEFNQKAKSTVNLEQQLNAISKDARSTITFKENINSNYDFGRKQSQQYDQKAFAAFESNTQKKVSQIAGAATSRIDQTPEVRRKESTLKEKLFQVIAPNENEDIGRKSTAPTELNPSEKLKRVNSSVHKDRPPLPESMTGALTYRIICDERPGSSRNAKKNVSFKRLEQVSLHNTNKIPERAIKTANLNTNERHNSMQNLHKNPIHIDREKTGQKLQRNCSQDQGSTENQQNKLYVKGTERELIQTYGRLQEARPNSKSRERGTKTHSSTTKVSTDIEQGKQHLFHQHKGNERMRSTSPLNQRIDARSNSVDASSKNYRALRSKKGDDMAHGHTTEIIGKENRYGLKREQPYIMKNLNL